MVDARTAPGGCARVGGVPVAHSAINQHSGPGIDRQGTAAQSPSCEFGIFAARARSMKIAAFARSSTLRGGKDSRHSKMAQQGIGSRLTGRGLCSRRLRRAAGRASQNGPSSQLVHSPGQRGADDWAGWEDRRAHHAKSPTSRNHPETQRLEQRVHHRAKAAFAAQTGLGNPGAARTGGQYMRSGFV